MLRSVQADARERGLVGVDLGEGTLAVHLLAPDHLLPDGVVGEGAPLLAVGNRRTVVLDELGRFGGEQLLDLDRSATEQFLTSAGDKLAVVPEVHRDGDEDGPRPVPELDSLVIGAFGRPHQSLLVLLAGIERSLHDHQTIARLRDEFGPAVVIGNEQVTTGDDPEHSVVDVAEDGFRFAVLGERVSVTRNVVNSRHDHGFVE